MKIQQILIGFVWLASSLMVQALPPVSGPYVTDPQSEHVQDQTSEGTNNASTILCYIANTRPDAMVNKGQYVAFIDEAQCSADKADASNSSSESSGASVEYTRMSLTSTRANETSAQITKGHASVSMNDVPTYVYFHASATEASSATAPNGVVTMDMAAIPVTPITGVPMVMRGRIDATASGTRFSMTEFGRSSYQLYVDGNDTAGSGAIRYPSGNSQTVVTFGYNSTTFCRQQDAQSAQCFDRSKANAGSSVWRYGVYDDSTGAQYDLAQPGFSVLNTANSQYGYASYWGIWFPTAATNGTVVQSTSGNSTSYTVVKTGGRLTKYNLVSKTLNEVAKVPFNFMPQTPTAVSGGNLLAYNTYEAYWDGAIFQITGRMVCSTSCLMLSRTLTATPSQMNSATNSYGLNGWSQALGGSLIIPASTLTSGTPGDSAVKYNTQSVVIPGDTTVPTTLKCARDCPTHALLSNLTTSTLPFTTGTRRMGGGTLAANVVSYTWDSANYTLSDSTSALTNDLLSYSSLPVEFKGGIRSGALVDGTDVNWSAGGLMDCATGGTTFCDYKSNNLDTYYVWENGTNDYQSATFLKKADNTTVTFTAPQSALFEVPNDATKYGTFAGAKMNLQFGGFGNLGGIPGKCFSTVTNLAATCSAMTRYVPAFSIPDNTSDSQLGKLLFNINGDSVTKWVKYLDRELRFKQITLTGSLADNGISLGVIGNLPAALALSGVDADDPSNSANSNYAGAVSANDFLAAPSVIQGVVQ